MVRVVGQGVRVVGGEAQRGGAHGGRHARVSGERVDGLHRKGTADEEAQRTCEVCGAPGRKRTGGWIAVRCDEHAEV